MFKVIYAGIVCGLFHSERIATETMRAIGLHGKVIKGEPYEIPPLTISQEFKINQLNRDLYEKEI